MKFCLDRFEGKMAVCLCEDLDAAQAQYLFSVELAPQLKTLSEGDIFEGTLDGEGALIDVCLLAEETKARRASAQSRLHALFARSKNKQ